MESIDTLLARISRWRTRSCCLGGHCLVSARYFMIDCYARVWQTLSPLTSLLLSSLHTYKSWSLQFGSCWSVPGDCCSAAWSVNTPHRLGYQGINSLIPINTAQAISCQQTSIMAMVAILSSFLLLLPDTYPSDCVFIEQFPVDTGFMDACSVYMVMFKLVLSCFIRHHKSAQIFYTTIVVFKVLDNAITGSTAPDRFLPGHGKKQSSYYSWRASKTALVTTPTSLWWSARWFDSQPHYPKFYWYFSSPWLKRYCERRQLA